MVIERVLLLEDNEALRHDVEEQLRSRGCAVSSVGALSVARDLLLRERFDLIVAEVRLPDGSITDLLSLLKGRVNRPVVLVISSFGSPESAVDAMQHGAFGFLLRPFSSDQLAVVLQKAEEHLRLKRLTAHFGRGDDGDLLGQSADLEQLRRTVRSAARSRAAVLIRGESGVGKALLARALHRQSEYADGPFVRVDCAGTPPADLEVELFGHDGTGTSGAKARPTGRIELAHHGTLLIDEIAELPRDVQASLARWLADRQFARARGVRPVTVETRLVATTGRPLDELVQRGQFRADLLMALSLLPISVPPLRAHAEDIPLLAEHFRVQAVRRYGGTVRAIAPAALAILCNHTWPGNVRELRHVIDQAVLRCRGGGLLEARHLSGALAAAAAAAAVAERDAGSDLVVPKVDTLALVEKAHILAVLERFRGNRTHAAAALGISLRTMRNKLHRYREEAAQDSSLGDPGL